MPDRPRESVESQILREGFNGFSRGVRAERDCIREWATEMREGLWKSPNDGTLAVDALLAALLATLDGSPLNVSALVEQARQEGAAAAVKAERERLIFAFNRLCQADQQTLTFMEADEYVRVFIEGFRSDMLAEVRGEDG